MPYDTFLGKPDKTGDKMKFIALIPARAGSQRVKSKNVRELCGHPLLAYTISAAIQSGIFERIIISTDSEETKKIAEHYGAEVPFLRPAELSSATAIDIEWITHAYDQINGDAYDAFALLRPTSPFRQVETIKRAAKQLEANPNLDSIRAVELCHQHPGKMWTICDDNTLKSFLPQGDMEVPWHARQYQDLPKVYIQNSSLEMARSCVVRQHKSREGKIIGAFLTDEFEGLAIDYESDWFWIEYLAKSGKVKLPAISQAPYIK